MIGDRRIVIAPFTTGVSNVLDCRVTVAPFGVHLQITAVLLNGRTRERGVCENATDFRTTQKMPPKLPSPLNICSVAALVDRAFDGRRSAGLEDLADNPCRGRANTRDPGKSAARVDDVTEGDIQPEDRRRGALV